jgi:hypothetical protein
LKDGIPVEIMQIKSFPSELKARIEAARKEKGYGMAAWVIRACREQLARDEDERKKK